MNPKDNAAAILAAPWDCVRVWGPGCVLVVCLKDRWARLASKKDRWEFRWPKEDHARMVAWAVNTIRTFEPSDIFQLSIGVFRVTHYPHETHVTEAHNNARCTFTGAGSLRKAVMVAYAMHLIDRNDPLEQLAARARL